MEPKIYEAVPHQARLLLYPGASAEDLAGLLGAENVNATQSVKQVRNSDGEWVTLGPGWHAGVRDDGSRVVKSPCAVKADYKKLEPSPLSS